MAHPNVWDPAGQPTQPAAAMGPARVCRRFWGRAASCNHAVLEAAPAVQAAAGALQRRRRLQQPGSQARGPGFFNPVLAVRAVSKPHFVSFQDKKEKIKDKPDKEKKEKTGDKKDKGAGRVCLPELFPGKHACLDASVAGQAAAQRVHRVHAQGAGELPSHAAGPSASRQAAAEPSLVEP